MREEKENVIEWLNGDEFASFTFSQKKYINKVESFVKEFPQFVTILARNEDGSVFWHICLNAIVLSHLALKKRATFAQTEEEKEEGDDEDTI